MLITNTFYVELDDGTEIEAYVAALCGYEDYGADADGRRGVREFFFDVEDVVIPHSVEPKHGSEVRVKLLDVIENFDWEHLYLEEKNYV